MTTKKIILITGCSSGIGYETAITLSALGHRVIASCRSKDDLLMLQERRLEAILLDVNSNESIEHAVKSILKKTEGRLDVLINNAGYGQSGALEDLARDTLRAQFETNVFGLMELTRHIIPIMREQGHGRIINISSVLGIISLPFRGAYNASKYALEGLSDTLRLELKSSGIHVILIEPGPIESQFRESSVQHALNEVNVKESYFKKQYQQILGDFQKQKSASIFTRPPAIVVKKIRRAIESPYPHARYKVTFPAHLLVILKTLLPTKLLDRFLLWVSKKELE